VKIVTILIMKYSHPVFSFPRLGPDTRMRVSSSFNGRHQMSRLTQQQRSSYRYGLPSILCTFRCNRAAEKNDYQLRH